jgi:hypothetical protein
MQDGEPRSCGTAALSEIHGRSRFSEVRQTRVIKGDLDISMENIALAGIPNP